MTHRDPEAERLPLDVRRTRSRPYEIAVLLACLVLAVAFGTWRRHHPAAALTAPVPQVEMAR